MYKPNFPFNVPFYLLQPVKTKKAGVTVKTYPETSENKFFGSFKTYGGTEREVNNLTIVENTATVETYYRPDIKAESAIKNALTGDVYEIISPPENIDMKNQYSVFKVRIYKGGV